MRILLITPYFYPHKGGSQQYALELYGALMKKNPEVKVDVICYNTDQSKSVEKYRGFTIYRISCIQILKGQFAVPNYISLWKTVNKLFRENRYDFLNSHTRFFESSWWAPYVALRFHTKSILTDHCASHPTHKTKIVASISYLADKFLVPFFIKKYDYLTTTNRAAQDFLNSLSNKHSEIIYGGVDIKSFRPAAKKHAGRKILNIKKTFSKNDIIIAFVGRMIYSKGPQILLEAAEKITKKHKNVYFIFGGNGPLQKELSRSKTSQIFFAGELSQENVSNLMRKTDILVHPSLHHEGFPNVLLEAGASECAVIATDMGGTYEIITPETGIMVKPTTSLIEKKIEYLIRNKSQRKKLARALRHHVAKNFAWTKISQEYGKFLEEKIHERSLFFPAMRMSSVPRN